MTAERHEEGPHDGGSDLAAGDLLRLADDHRRGLHDEPESACIRCRLEPILGTGRIPEAHDTASE